MKKGNNPSGEYLALRFLEYFTGYGFVQDLMEACVRSLVTIDRESGRGYIDHGKELFETYLDLRKKYQLLNEFKLEFSYQ